MATGKTTLVPLSAQEDVKLTAKSVNVENTDEYQEPESLTTTDRAEMEMQEIVNKDNNETKENEGLPIDKGWAWMVLAGAAFYLILHGGIKKNFGIIFVAIQDRFDSSASLTSLLTTMQNLVTSFSSFITMTIGMQFMSNQMSIMIGAFVVTISHIISAFSTDIRMLFLSTGFLEGIGIALSFPSVIATVGEYFDKRRGLATGLAFSGSNFGALVFAPTFSALFEDIGYTGTLMIIAGITFNILVTAALLKPIQSFKRRTLITNTNTKVIKETGETKETETVVVKGDALKVNSRIVGNGVQSERHKTEEGLTQLVLENEHIDILQQDAEGSQCTLEITRSDLCDQHSPVKETTEAPLLHRSRAWSLSNRRKSTSSQHSNKDLSPLNSLVDSLTRSRVALYSSADVISAPAVTHSFPSGNAQGKTIKDQKLSFRSKLKASFDINLFRSLLFPVFLLMAAMLSSTSLLLPVFLAPLSRDMGLSAEKTGLLMSVVGGVGMFSRILYALFADRKYVKLTTLLAVVSILAGLAAHCVRFFKTFPSLVFIAVLFGLCCEIYQSMYPVILVEYLTLPKLKSCIGFTLLCHGLAVASTFPVVGSLRDSTGNYTASYHLLGTMSFVGALLALSLPYLHRRKQL